jgi:glycosyltransferase involved in cell wall biosynthesis
MPDQPCAAAAHEIPAKLSICHFSIAQTRLKSRSFHMQCFPLAMRGARVTFIAPIGISGQDKGVEFVSPVPARNTPMRFLPRWSLVRALLAQKQSVYHFQDVQLLPVALALKLLLGRKIVYDAYEDFPSMAQQSGRRPRILKKLAASIICVFEWLAARFADGIITADSATMRRFAKRGPGHRLVFYNFPNVQFFPKAAMESRAKAYDLVYRGGLSERAGTYDLLEALGRVREEGLSANLLLIGYSDDRKAKEGLSRRVRELGLESSVCIAPRIEHQEMAAALSSARVGVCPLRATPKFQKNIPVKVFEYWACELPVVVSDLPPIRPFFRGSNAGLMFHPGDVGELTACIRWMLTHRRDAEEMGKRGRAQIAGRFNNEREIPKLHRMMQRIAAS